MLASRVGSMDVPFLPTAALLSGNEHMRDQQLQDGVTAEEEGGRSKERPRH